MPRCHRGHWKDYGKIPDVQNYCEYGLELIFHDVVACQYICSCCYECFPEHDIETVIYHSRSLSHVKAALVIQL